MSTGKILFSTHRLPGREPEARLPHRVQSPAAHALADRLQSELGPAALISKSHSRTLAAAAAAGAPVTALGIDIEWRAPDRPFTAILREFWPDAPEQVGLHNFYRAWTFLEAHFKAHQRWPLPADIKHVLTIAEGTERSQTPSGDQIFQCLLAENFQVTLLWHCETACDVEERK